MPTTPAPANTAETKPVTPSRPTPFMRIVNLGYWAVYFMLGIFLAGFLGNKFILLMEQSAPFHKPLGKIVAMKNATTGEELAKVHIWCEKCKTPSANTPTVLFVR